VAYRHLRKADTTRLLRDMEKTLGDYYMHTLAYKVLRLYQRFHLLLASSSSEHLLKRQTHV
jgi:hypothetical protein